jgi:hypothetical protein
MSVNWVPADIWDKIFTTVLEDKSQVETVWQIAASPMLICKYWNSGKSRIQLRQKLIEMRYPQLFKRYASFAPQQWSNVFVEICRFRNMRRRFEYEVAQFVAYGRLNGVLVPYLWVTESFLQKSIWDEKFLGWDSPVQANSDILKLIEMMKTCTKLILHPPRPLYFDETEIPKMAQVGSPFGDMGHNFFYALECMTRKIIGMKYNEAMDAFLVGVTEQQCLICNNIGKEVSVAAHKPHLGYGKSILCMSCWRHVYQLVGELWHSGKILVLPGPTLVTETETLGNDQRWYPDVEILCQKICLELVHPDNGELSLSHSGLRCILGGGVHNTLVDSQFVPQMHVVYEKGAKPPKLPEEDEIPDYYILQCNDDDVDDNEIYSSSDEE